MKVINVDDLVGTEREVNCPRGGFKSLRFLLEKDGMGYTLTTTIIPVGGPQLWHYKNHLETCLCIKGRGEVTDLATGARFSISPGMAYVLDKNDRHTFQAFEEVVLVCVFNPPLHGREVHRDDGSYSI